VHIDVHASAAPKAQPVAERAIHEQQAMMLSVRDSAVFLEVLSNPPEPNARLHAAWKRYKSMLGTVADPTADFDGLVE
jgi:uncharacterized protein (DUF1778 family)